MSAFSDTPVFSVLLTAMVTFVFSYIVVFLMRKIPVLRKVVP